MGSRVGENLTEDELGDRVDASDAGLGNEDLGNDADGPLTVDIRFVWLLFGCSCGCSSVD